MENMEKILSAGAIREISFNLSSIWDSVKKDIKVSGKTMYALIGLRNKLFTEGDHVTEAIRQIAENAGATQEPNGALKVPDEKIQEVNETLKDLYDEQITIGFTPLVLGPDDSLPLDLMDILYDFIEMSE